jgi:hypothetical protein
MESVTGAPTGMMTVEGYPVTAMALPAACTLPAFADGLVERKGRLIETEFVQSRGAISRDGRPHRQLGAGLVSRSTHRESDDDGPIQGMRWTD